MTITITPARQADIEYPDSDGQPIADNTLQFQWIVTIKEGLDVVFRDDPRVFVAGDLLWYPVQGKPKIRNAPDVMVAFNRPKGYRGSYRQWDEEGVAPQVVFEVLSPGNRAAGLVLKFKFYELYGVEEFYLYDPETGALDGFLRGIGGLEVITEMSGFTSPRLGIRFEPGEGPDNLKIIGPDGRPFLTYLELFEDREAQQRLADAERQRADAERQRADAERQRADRLAERLREIGLDPA